MTFPEDPFERCALSDILTEVAIMDDVTALYLQASAAAARAPQGTLTSTGSRYSAGDGLPADLGSAHHHHHRSSSGLAVSRQQSSGGGSESPQVGRGSPLNPSDGCPAVCLLDFGVTTGACWLVQVCRPL